MTPSFEPDLESVYRDHFDYVWTNLRRLGVPRSALEDACQDVFLVVHRRLDSYDSDSSLRTWLFGIIRRVAADHRRRGRREHRKHTALARAQRSPSNPGDRWAQRVWLQGFLDTQPQERREAFVMLELTQLTAKEASALSGVNANTLSARLRAVRRELSEAWGRDDATLGPAIEASAIEEQADAGARKRVLAALIPFGVNLPAGPTAVSPLRALGIASTVTLAAVVVGAVVARPAPPEPGPLSQPTLANAAPPPARRKPTAAAPKPAVAPEPAAAPKSAVAPKPAVAREPAPAQEPAAIPAPVPSPAPKDDLAAQTELAERVFAESRPGQVLRLVASYDERFPGGFFSDRLSVRAVEAHCKLGQQRDADRRTAALRKHSKSLAERAERRCSAALDTKPEPSGHQGGQ